MAKCPYCDKEISDNAKKCIHCNRWVDKKEKECKYCKSIINRDAKVCPNCRRDQRIGNNPLWLIPIFIIIAIGLYFYLSPSAPLKVREVVCGLGLRDDFRYCSYFVWEKR